MRFLRTAPREQRFSATEPSDDWDPNVTQSTSAKRKNASVTLATLFVGSPYVQRSTQQWPLEVFLEFRGPQCRVPGHATLHVSCGDQQVWRDRPRCGQNTQDLSATCEQRRKMRSRNLSHRDVLRSVQIRRVNIPSHKCDGFPAKPRTNVPASRPKDGSQPQCETQAGAGHACQQGNARVPMAEGERH